ncbi:hypothetical protein KM043_001478 [Ampulex compressa]|nr:hypothetical protein KM043_001478 [Ampulex compressa]
MPYLRTHVGHDMTSALRDKPWGLQAIECMCSTYCPHRRVNRMGWHQGGVLALTYLAYTCYHMTRKPISVVKNVLSLNCSTLSPPMYLVINDTNRDTWCDWAPFDTADAPALLGMLDSAFLFAYAAAMFLSGFIAERVNLRYFLSFGMLASGISCYLFGIAKPYNIHSLWYFVLVQAMGGVFQTTGWPGVVTIVGHWFGRGKRGFIFGGVMGVAGFIIFLFLIPNPTDIGCIPPNALGYRRVDVANSSDEGSGVEEYRNYNANAEDDAASLRSETSPILLGHRRVHDNQRESAIGFMGALAIPGVIEYSLSLFFAKLVSYTFLYWLPLYISASTTYSATLSADVSTLFDVGGIAGAIMAGVLSDYTGMSALTCAVMLGFAVPALFIYDHIGNASLGVNIILLLIAGVLVNGPYALITTAVSAELGTHPSLGDNSKALATVTAIIDGTGSIGAAVGPLLAGFVSRWAGWHNVFYMLMIADMLALLLLTRLVYRDIQQYRQRRCAV